MNRLLYEKSVSYKGHLIIPFIFSRIGCETIYSYKLLAQGYTSPLHQSENLSGICTNNLDDILKLAKQNLDEKITNYLGIDPFRDRYIYQKHLIILHYQNGKYFYDHYPPEELTNIAAPKLFISENDCLCWIKHGLDQHKVG